MTTTEQKAAGLLALHHGPGFVLPNAWDAGSARLLEQAGFPAIATTSAGIAWSLGIPDGERLDRDTMLEHVARIAAAVDVPVSADLEAGYGDSPTDVAETVRRAREIGVVGGNLEDTIRGRLLEPAEAAERIGAARDAAPAGSFVINARIDTWFVGTDGDPFAEAVDRATRYLAAGADCAFVPAVPDADTIGRLVEAVPGPLNIVAGLASTVAPATLLELGVQRVSVGGGIARAAYGLVERAARELRETGTLGFLDGALPYPDLQQRFGR